MMSRRQVVLGMPVIVSGCASLGIGGNTIGLDQAKLYADDFINALSAAATTYLASPSAKQPSLVAQLVANLQQSKTAIDAVVSASDAHSIVLEALSFGQQLAPLVMPFLGVAAPYVPLAIAVLQAFVQSLPPPPDTPATPPAQLHTKALQYHSRSRDT